MTESKPKFCQYGDCEQPDLLAENERLRHALAELVAERTGNGYHAHLGSTYGLELARAALARTEGEG